MYPLDPPAQIYESVGDDLFQEYTTSINRWYPKAVGDADQDGLQEIITGEFDHGPWTAVVGIYEQPDAFSYPTAKTTEFLTPQSVQATAPLGIAIDDLDGDHIVDLDNDGWKEALVGGVDYFIMYEAWADDSYRPIWWTESDWNIRSLAYVGDSDGDSLKEFLVGSAGTSSPGHERCTLFEYDGAGGFEVTWEVTAPWDLSNPEPQVEAADLDGDGLRELICTREVADTFVLEIYKSTGDN